MTQNAPIAGTYTIEYHDGRGNTGVSDRVRYDHDWPSDLVKQAFERCQEAAL